MIPPHNLTIPNIKLSAPPERVTIARHSGPGLRLIVWVQGCSLLCTRHCLNPQLLKQDGGYRVQASRLIQSLLRGSQDYSEVEGVTVLGGEPFDQVEALAYTFAPLRRAGLSIMIYTGHTLEDLRAKNDDAVNRLLSLCDILIDGPFVDELHNESLIWRGSSNQRILLLSQRYTDDDIERALSRQKRAAAISVGPRGDVMVSGAQNLQTARRLRQLTVPAKHSRESLSQGGTKR
jgi:anaerobic ribonucleoside-triphosphate reductase activating protein